MGPGEAVWKKNLSLKISRDCPFKILVFYSADLEQGRIHSQGAAYVPQLAGTFLLLVHITDGYLLFNLKLI